MNYKLLGDRVMVEPDKIEEATESGILLVPTEVKKVFTGKVVAVGAGKWIVDGLGIKRQEMELTVGDHVYFPRYAGVDVKGAERATLILRQSDIICKVEE